jgi:NADPH:quinone reductase-like Zn-dependent oxidoreductase
MESVVIFSEKSMPKRRVKTSGEFILDGVKMRTGIIEEEDTILKSSDNFKNSVLVKKTAFSCNYRDKPFLFYIDKKIKEGGPNGDRYFSHVGSEFVGEIVDVGKNVKKLKIGDKVIPNISYPSYNEDYKSGLPTNGASKRMEIFNQNKLLKVPKEIPDEILAGFPVSAFTAYSMIRKVIKPRAKVLVTAAKSNTSLAVIKALNKKSVKVYAMTSSYGFKDKIMSMGVEDVFIVNSNLDFSDNDQIKKILNFGGFDAVIDPFFDIYFSKVIAFLAMGSKYITCGLCNQFIEEKVKTKDIDSRSFFINLMINNISIIGNCIGTLEDGLEAINDYINDDFDIVLDSIYGKGEENLFFERTFNFKERFGKVVYKY